MSDLWTTASADAAEADHRKLTATLRIESVQYWPFLAEAESSADFSNRLALVSPDLDSIVRRCTKDAATFITARAELEESFKKDFATVEAARTVEGDYHYVKPAGGGKYKIVQKGTGKTLSVHDSKEEAESAFRAMEMHMHGGSKREDAERDSAHMVGSVCRGCGEPQNKRDGKVVQRDLGSPEKWHKECYQMYNRRLKSNPNADKYHGASLHHQAGYADGSLSTCHDCGNPIRQSQREVDGSTAWHETDGGYGRNWGDDRDYQCGLSMDNKHHTRSFKTEDEALDFAQTKFVTSAKTASVGSCTQCDSPYNEGTYEGTGILKGKVVDYHRCPACGHQGTVPAKGTTSAKKVYCPCGKCGKPCEVVGKVAKKYKCDECRGR